MRLNIGKKLKTASLNWRLTGSKKEVYFDLLTFENFWNLNTWSYCFHMSLPTNNLKGALLHLKNYQRWSRGHKARGQGQGHKKNPRPRPRPRTAFPRTDTLEAKDRNARGQGQGPRTQSASALQKKKKKVFTKIFQAISKKKKKKKKRSSQKFFKRYPLKNVFQKIFQAFHKILTFQKIVLSSSRGQANFRGLEASRPRPRTWPSRPRPRTSKCVLEDSTSENYSMEKVVLVLHWSKNIIKFCRSFTNCYQ